MKKDEQHNSENNNSKPSKSLENITSINSNIPKLDYIKLDTPVASIISELSSSVTSIVPIIEKFSAIDFTAINSSMLSVTNAITTITNSISPITERIPSTLLSINEKISSISNSISPIIEKVSAFDYSSITNQVANISNSISPIISEMEKINISAFSNTFSYLEDYLVKLSFDKENFNNFIQNFEPLSNSIDLDALELNNISQQDSLKIKQSSIELVEKVITGTLEYSDVQNNRPLCYAIIALKFLIVFIFSYMLTKGLDYITDEDLSTTNSNEVELISQYSSNLKIVIVDVLNVRESPTTKSNIISQLNNFDIVKVINEQPYWFEIEYIDLSDNQTKTGWISKRYTTDYTNTLESYLEYFSNE